MKKLTLNNNQNSQLEFINDHSDSMDFLNDKQYHLSAKSGHLILSSTAGSIVSLSSSLSFPDQAKYHIRTVNM